MHAGLMMECDYRAGKTQEEAFHEAFATAQHAEEWGFDGVWLAERHFAPPESGRAIPSVVASPLIVATAIAARTTRIRVGTAVLVVPLGHPVRMAEEVATLDHISQGRLDLGIGRSGFPWAYEGYNIPYAESRARFQEFFDVMLRIGIYVAEDKDRAFSEPRESTMSFYNRMRQGLLQTAGAFGGELRAQRAQNLASLTYESALQDRLIYGTPDAVVNRIKALRDELGLSGILMEPNVGGLMTPERLDNSIRLFGQEVAPQLGS